MRLYSLAKKHVTAGKKRISLEDLRKVLGLQSVKDAEGNIIQEAPLPIWANFSPEGVGRCDIGDQQEDGHQHRSRVAGAIKTSKGNDGHFCD